MTARVLGLIALAWLTGCGGHAPAPRPAPPPPPAPAPPPAAGRTLDVHMGVDPIAAQCEAGARESCNAIDDDCNGVIDDDCGYGGGAIQVTIGWDTGADIDLYVTDPSGQTLFYNEQNRRSTSGGHFDHDARGDCRAEQRSPRIENVYWPAPAPPGSYKLELHYFGPCGDHSQTHVTIAVAALGRPLGLYRYQLKPEERVQALTFEIR